MEQLTPASPASDTICAISTPAGSGGIAVARVSGPDAVECVMRLWRGADLRLAATHTAHFGRIADDDGTTLDEVVATVFRAPKSFTGEDTVEISCHGSVWVQRRLLALLCANGCRAAEGGEFTRRAFVNGRLDLSQAEAIADLIASSSRAAHHVAVSQMRGGISRELAALRSSLLEFASLLELELDFSEEEVEFADRQRLLSLAATIEATISRLADSFATGNAIKNGFPTVIVGETNAGKSTLLNRLLHDDKALVSDISGTTRDVIEDTVSLGGVTFRFIDTAGIRDTADAIESMGIERTFKKIGEAAIVIWLVDPTQPTGGIAEMAARIAPLCDGKRLIAAVNKVDAVSTEAVGEATRAIAQAAPSATPIAISAKAGTAIDSLESLLVDAANVGEAVQEAVVVTNARHHDALTRARAAISRAIGGLSGGLSGDFVAQDIRECMHYLGEITGEITTHEILGSIFSRFCLGK